MKIPDPVLIRNSDTMRDGGSYMLTYEAVDGGLFEVELKVIMSNEFKRVGYNPPTVQHYDPVSLTPIKSTLLSWDQGLDLREKLLPLLNSQIEFGGLKRASEMLHLLALRGSVE